MRDMDGGKSRLCETRIDIIIIIICTRWVRQNNSMLMWNIICGSLREKKTL